MPQEYNTYNRKAITDAHRMQTAGREGKEEQERVTMILGRTRRFIYNMRTKTCSHQEALRP